MAIPKLITNVSLCSGGFYFGGFEMESSCTQKMHSLFGNVANERVVSPSCNDSLVLNLAMN